MEVFFSTVIRSALPKQGGELVRLDWDQKAIIGRTPIFASNPELDDPNPRGNTRGGRGILLLDNQVVIASYHTLRVYNRELRHLRDISHRLMVGLHEGCLEKNSRIWTSSTTIDAALQVDLENGRVLREFWPREMRGIQQRYGVRPLEIDKQADNRARFLSNQTAGDEGHVHLNALAVWQGEVYALFNRFGAIVNLDRDEVFIEDPACKGGHNLLILEDGTAIVNGTLDRRVQFYDLHRRELKKSINLMKFPVIQNLARRHDLVYAAQKALHKVKLASTPPARALFVRGLDMLDNLLFVGISPASILCLDWRRDVWVDIFSYSQDVRVCIHGLKVAERIQ